MQMRECRTSELSTSAQFVNPNTEPWVSAYPSEQSSVQLPGGTDTTLQQGVRPQPAEP